MNKNAFTTLAFAFACIGQAVPSLATSCDPVNNVSVTFYGWPDNSPPGPANAFDCGRGKDSNGEPIAGGTGTYDDPISFATATDNNNFPQCGLVYVPSLHKYFRNEDDCAECKTDWDGLKHYHIDLWTGSNTQGGGDGQITCEDNLPGGQLTIINDPPGGLPVDTSPLYDVSSGACSNTTYPVGDTSSLCSGGGSGGGSGSSSTQSSPASSLTSLVVPPPTTLSTTTTPSATTTLSTSATLSTTTTRRDQGHGSSSSSRTPTSSATKAPCVWKGHCLGAPCKTYNDCDGTNICGKHNVCVPLS